MQLIFEPRDDDHAKRIIDAVRAADRNPTIKEAAMRAAKPNGEWIPFMGVHADIALMLANACRTHGLECEVHFRRTLPQIEYRIVEG